MRKDARMILDAAIDSVKPAALMHKAVSLIGGELFVGSQQFNINALDKIFVIAAGKAAAAMAAEVENILGDHLTGGLAVTKYGHQLPLKLIRCIEAGHPVPDAQSVLAAKQILNFTSNANENDLFIFLLSGGASALIADLPEGIELEEMQHFSQLLLHSGADIHELNIIRKHISVLKGGQLSRQVWPASLVCLAMSDVPGDLPESIGSGPAVPDSSTFAEAWKIIEKYKLEKAAPNAICVHLLKGRNGLKEETPKPGDPVFWRTFFSLVGHNNKALKTAAETAKGLGYHAIILPDQYTGDAETEAKKLFNSAKKYDGKKPVCLLAGGESTVAVKGTGKGGRNQHMALTVLNDWICDKDDLPHLLFLSSATDGTDGPTDAAGAMVDDRLVKEIIEKDLPVSQYLKNNDSYHFFKNNDMHIVTGPTQTNVMDIVIILIKE